MAPPTKRQELPGALVLVATPIGNLGDLAPRARAALAAADAVAAEDTRRAQALFAALGLGRPVGGFVRADAHAERGAGAAEVLARLARGERVVFVTDAGTPGVADPGAELVRRARAEGFAVEALPGPSALALAQSLAGFEATALAFIGFLPRDDAGRDALADTLVDGVDEPGAAAGATWAFESPQRVVESLARLAARAPAGTRAFAAKELTKVHERHFHGTLAEVAAAVADEVAREGARGEWVVGWEPGPAVESGGEPDRKAVWNESLADCAAALARAGARPAEVARALSQIFGFDRRELYREIIRRAR